MADSRRPQDMWRKGDGAKPSPRGSPSAPRGPSKKGKLFRNALILAAVLGVVLGLLTFLRPAPEPIYLSIAVTEYTNPNWPVNAFARQDSEALRKHFGVDSDSPVQSQQRDRILSKLNEVADLSRDKLKGRPIIVHFSANALVHDGSVYVLPSLAKPGITDSWIRLDELLEPIKRAQGNRLLFLDLRPVVDARLGALSDDLAETLNAALDAREKANDLPFRVACACGPGSSPVISRELRRSAFGYFLDRGLAGFANGWNNENRISNRVSSLELLTYTEESTSAFSTKYQQPSLPTRYGQGKDFDILPVPQGGPTAVAKPETADAYPDWLLAGWKERDRWQAEGAHRRLQRTYRHLEAALLRAESQWLGGAELTEAQRHWESEWRDLKAIKQKYPNPIPPVRSLARVPKSDSKTRGDAEILVRPIIDRIKATPTFKMEDLAEVQKLQKQLGDKAPDANVVAEMLFRAAVDRNEPTIEQFKQIVLTLQSLSSVPKYAELMMLSFIAKVDPARLKYWKPGPPAPETQTIPRLLMSIQAGEQAVACDGRALPWIRKDLLQTDALRREAIVNLLQADFDGRAAALVQINGCRARYDLIQNAGQALGQAFRELDETRVFLASWNGFEAPDAKIQQELDVLWSRLAGQCRELIPLLNPPTEPRLPNAEQLSGIANDLQRGREQVLELVKMPPNSANSYDLQRWLAWPFWNAEKRAIIADRMSERGVPGVEQALGGLPEKPSNQKQSPPDDRTNRNNAAYRRARHALDLLRLSGDIEAAKLEAKFEALAKKPDARGYQDLGSAISLRWSEQLPERYKQAKMAEQAAMGWAIHPFDLLAVARSGDTFSRDASAEFIKQQQKEFAAWIGEFRDQLDARALGKVEGVGPLALSLALDELAREQLNWSP